jgi:hypothetical protein
MINNLFNSDRNKNAIKSIINEKIQDKYNYEINNNYDSMINETMTYVLSQVSSKPPKGMPEQEYLFLMNKKVYDIVYPIIDKSVTSINKKKPVPEIQNTKSNYINPSDKKTNISINDNLFDPVLIKNYETQALMDYPKPGAIKISNDASAMQMKKIESDRSTLTPKIKPIDFSMKTDNEDKGITVQMYNDLLTTYNKQVDNMSTFEDGQKNINKKIESIEENQLLDYNNNQNMYTPIDLLKNKKETSNFFQTENNNETGINSLLKSLGNNVAFNRNDIETFVSSNDNDDNDVESEDTFKKNINFGTISNDNRNNFNNDLNSYTINQIPNLEFSGTIQKTPVILEPKFKLIEKKYFIIFDSKDRDLELYQLPSSFQVKFAPSTNNYVYNAYSDSYGTLILSEKNIVYASDTQINIQETFDNIKSIRCTYSSVPTNVIWYASQGPQISELGIPRSIYCDPYVYLVIPEIKGPYRGGNTIVSNAFSKLGVNESSNVSGRIISNYFTALTCSSEEVFLYDPVLHGKIDKMTLQMYNKYGQLYDFGIDKLYIESFEVGKPQLNGYCGDTYVSTSFFIQSTNSDYVSYCARYYKNTPCDVINSHPIRESNKIYFYSTIPNQDQIAFLEDNIYISKLKYNSNKTVNIYLSYKKVIDGKEKTISVSLKNIIPGGSTNNSLLFKDYLIVIYDKNSNKYYYLSIVSFTNTYVVVNVDSLPVYSKYSNIKIGIAKKNLRGNTDSELNSLFCVYGFIVVNIGIDKINNFKIEINFPYENLPQYIKDGHYNPGDIFLIQDKMQISYNFEITTMVKDYVVVNSKINDSGNN